MSNSKTQFYFLLALLFIGFTLAFFVLKPFFYTLIVAVAFAIVFKPLYSRVNTLFGGKQRLASLLTIVTVGFFVFVPIVFLGFQIFIEAQELYFTLIVDNSDNVILNTVDNTLSSLQKKFPYLNNVSLDTDQYLRQGLSWFIEHLDSIFSSFAKMLLNFFIFLLAFYYLLVDGHKLKSRVIALSPLADVNDEFVYGRLILGVNSVVRGNLIIAVIQGALTSLGFIIFGVPNAFLWGSVAAIAALIPSIGTALVLGPAIIFLFVSGELFSSIGLLAWGIGAVGLIDNFLGPKLVSHGIQLHPLIVLLSVLGGIVFFGPIGFILGPIVVGLLSALLDIYRTLLRGNATIS